MNSEWRDWTLAIDKPKTKNNDGFWPSLYGTGILDSLFGQGFYTPIQKSEGQDPFWPNIGGSSIFY